MHMIIRTRREAVRGVCVSCYRRLFLMCIFLVSVLAAVRRRRGRDVVTPGQRDAVTPPLLLTYVIDV